MIIPNERQKEKAHAGSLSLHDALSFIQERRTDLLHLPAIESEAYYRLRRYPAQIQDSLHQGLITIPRKLAYVLHEKAAYISPAVEAFYLRDPIALRPLQCQRPSKLLFLPEDFVTVSVKFTKVGFAQLKGQDFETPRAWTTSDTKVRDVFGQKGYEMGMKVTCGFEMLMSDPQNIDKKPVREINLLLEDLQAGEEHLPSDQEMSKWEWRDDDESWLDINFEDFEKELSGRSGQTPLGRSAGFGDKTAHENLRRMVSRFEKYLDDDDGAVQDAEFLDDMDNDDDSDNFDPPTSGESEEQNNEKEPDFDEDRFASMMKEMMGLPATGTTDSSYTLTTNRDSSAIPRAESDGADEAKEIRKMMHQMETELRDVGALSLEPPPIDRTSRKKPLPLLEKSDRNAAITQVSRPHETPQDQSSSDDESELDIDFKRARELLDQFTAI